MATIEKIDKELNDAKARFGEVTEELKEWEEKENKGKWLNELGMKLFNEEWKDGGEKKKWEDKVKELEEEKKRLVESKGRWEVLYQELLRGGEGNEQIA